MVLSTLLAALLGLLASPVHANTIEGFTPSGQFQTVGLDDQGKFLVSFGTVALGDVVVTSGTINVTQAPGTVLQVAGNLSVTASSATVTHSAQVTVTTSSGQLLPSDNGRKQGVICNNEDIFGTSTVIYIGPPGVTTGNGFPLPAGSCYSPDSPASMQGEIDAVSTATAHAAYIYHN